MMHAAIGMLLLLLTAGQEDQAPRPPAKNSRGLLQVNRHFYDLAASTGGDFYFWAAGEFGTSNLQIPIEHEEVVLAYGSVDEKRVFDIPVESGVRSLEIFAGIQRKDLAVLVRPDGVVVRERDEGASLQSTQHMLIATIAAPQSGVWKLELHGAGLFCVTAHVKPAAKGPELVQIDNVCEFEVAGDVRKYQIEFVARDGTTIGRPDAAHCIAPDVPFRVAITGLDANGKEFRRVERALRSPH